MPPSHEDIPSTVLARRGLDGDEGALSQLVARWNPFLLARAGKLLQGPLRDLYDREDLVNDAWQRALPGLPVLGDRDGRLSPVVKKYLVTTLIHRYNSLAQKHLFGKLKKIALENPAEDDQGDAYVALPAQTSGVVERLARSDLHDSLHRALQRLPETDREVVYLRGIDMVSNQEAAVILGISEANTSMRYRRALEKLRAILPASLYEDLVLD